MSYGARYLAACDAAALCRMAHRMAVDDECHFQAPVFAREATHHEAEAASLRQQLLAARKLGMGGSAGKFPPGYFDDAPSRGESTPPA